MELAGEDVVARDAGNEGPPVVGYRARDGLIIGHHVVRVDEIHERAVGHAIEQGRALPNRDRVPPHVRHLHRRRGASGRKPDDPPGNHAEPPVRPELFAFAEQELKSQADAEKRLAGANRPQDRLHESVPLQIAHAIAEGAHAGQHHVARVGDRLRVARDRGAVPDGLEGLVDRLQVAHFVINNRNHVSAFFCRATARRAPTYRLPLVESTPLTLASIATAWSKALASALKMDSMTWCGFRPYGTFTCRFMAACVVKA